MPPVFNQYKPNPHPYESALVDLYDSTDLEDLAMERNLRYDHRVSKEREHALHRHIHGTISKGQLNRAVVRYFENHVRESHNPDFLEPNLNKSNILIGPSKLRGNVRLLRVLNLSRLMSVYQWGKAPRNKRAGWAQLLTGFPKSINDKEILNWLNHKFEGKSKLEIRQIISIIIEIMNEYRQSNPYQPTWATRWTLFKSYINNDADTWNQVVGIPSKKSQWIVLLSYPAKDAKTLVRPSQLDAGWNGYHFPSPPSLPLSLSGHPSSIRKKPVPRRLLPEYIHQQIDHRIEHWENANFRIGRTTGKNNNRLDISRLNHHRILKKKFGRSVISMRQGKPG